MAAIDLTRLDQQITHLASLYQDPAAFQAELHSILSFYHRYSHRKSKDSTSRIFMRNYDLPEKVLVHLEARLKPLSLNYPDEALKLIDQLWKDTYFESRKIATSLAGNLPISHSDSVLELIDSWLQQPLDQALSDEIIKNTSRTIIQQSPEKWRNFIHQHLFSPIQPHQKIGLLALAKFIPNSQLDELPSFFSWIRGFLLSTDTNLDIHLHSVIKALAQKSQQETTYLLREVLTDSNDAQVGRRIRHFLEFFEEPGRSRILSAIKNQVVLPNKIGNS